MHTDQYCRNKKTYSTTTRLEQRQTVKEQSEIDIERKYYVKNNGFNVVVKEIKQRIKSETTKLQKYVERNNQIVQKKLFQTNQKLVCEKIKGKSRQNDKKPTAEES